MDHPARRRTLQQRLADHEIDALLVTDELNVRYLTGFTGDSTYLLVTADEVTLLSDRRYETQLEAECGDLPKRIRGPERTMTDVVRETVAGLPGDCQRVGLEAARLPWSRARAYRKGSSDRQWIPTSDVVEQQRLTKDSQELAILRRAVRIAERAFQALVPRLRPGWTELEMAYELESTMRSLGASGCGFDPIVAIDANAALPHAQPGMKKLAESGVLLIDWGARFEGYTSDLTRTLAIGRPDPEFAKVHDIVRSAQLAAIDKMAPGVALSDIDAAARDVITAAGYGERFGHGLGHGIGLFIHESPRMASIAEGVLQPGMVVTVEPGIYLPGRFGVRIEDDVLITDQGCEVLSELPKGLDDCVIML